MTTQTEALKLALEPTQQEQRITNLSALTVLIEENHKLKAALNLACSYLTYAQIDEIADKMPAQPKEPEQELFGYFCYDLRLDAWVQNRAGITGTPFYTTPPQRTWVGLTDEMVLAGARALAKRHADSCGLDFDDVWKYYAEEHKIDAKAVIEAAHGIKE